MDGGYVSFPSQNVVAFEEEDVGENASFSGKRPGNRIENRGVVPDVCVVVSPSAHLRGEDPQLDAATSEALLRVHDPSYVQMVRTRTRTRTRTLTLRYVQMVRTRTRTLPLTLRYVQMVRTPHAEIALPGPES